MAAAARAQPREEGDLFIFFFEGIVLYSLAARDYILAAMPGPSGAAQEARSGYPAGRGTLGPEIFKLSLRLDIQAVTDS